MTNLPKLPDDLAETLETLHAYSTAVGTIPRTLAIPHPKWWHVALTVHPNGLETTSIPTHDGVFHVRMDPRTSVVVVETSIGEIRQLPMSEGLTATELGDALIEIVSDFGIDVEWDRSRYMNDDPRPYDQHVAKSYFRTLTQIDRVIERHRASLAGSIGPIQVWPHGFDCAFEWFGTRTVDHEENGESQSLPSQINLGFAPAGRAYFYSNPWPFEADKLLDVSLPHGATWHTDGWEGSLLYYDDVAGRTDAAERVLQYANAVFEAAAPTLLS